MLVQTAAALLDKVDSVTRTVAIVLAGSPIARLLLFGYVVLLHLWVMTVLNTHVQVGVGDSAVATRSELTNLVAAELQVSGATHLRGGGQGVPGDGGSSLISMGMDDSGSPVQRLTSSVGVPRP